MMKGQGQGGKLDKGRFGQENHDMQHQPNPGPNQNRMSPSSGPGVEHSNAGDF